MNTKPEIRDNLLDRRRRMRQEEVASKSRAVVDRLIAAIPWHDIYSLSTYYPSTQRNEVDSRLLLDWLWQNHPKLITASPRVLAGGRLQNVKISPSTAWQKNRLGVLEPLAGQVLDEDHPFDVVVVPTLGFDQEGYRIGYGGGYYDRFLKLQPQAGKIGMAYEDSFVRDGLPREAHDIGLDMIVTEKRIIEPNHVD